MLFHSWLRSIATKRRRHGYGEVRIAASVAPSEQLETRQLLTLLTTDQTAFVDVTDPANAIGQRSQLVIRINLQDKLLSADGTFTDAEIRAHMQLVSAFHERQTFGQVSFPDAELDIVPGTITIPYTEAQIEDGSTPGAPSSASSGLHDSATAAAAALGYDLNSYDHLTVIHPSLGGRVNWYGLASVPGRKHWENANLSLGAWSHEFGHNFSASHSGVFIPNDVYAVISDPEDATEIEGGTGLDVMGGGGTDPSGDEFGKWKTKAGWFDIGTETINVTANSGTYRLHATDDGGSIVNGRHYALRIRRNDIQDYWIDYRARTTNQYLDNGAVFVTTNFSDAADALGFTSGPRVLDLTPESVPGDYGDGDGADGTLLVGRTYSDFDAQLHFTVLARHEEAGNNYLDIEINKGSFPGNNGPVTSLTADIINAAIGQTVSFTGTASDADNDPLSTHWNFGDGSFTANTLTPTHAFSAAGDYVVTFEASDRKGGSATRKILIKVAAPNIQAAYESTATVNTYTTSDQTKPAVASNGTDKFVAVWASNGQDGASNGIYGQRLDANGAAAGGEFQVSTTTSGSQSNPDVAMAANGTFVVVWEGQGASGQDDVGIFAQRFNADGSKAGSEFQVNTNTFASQSDAQVKINKTTGDFIVVWTSNVTDRNVRMRRFAANGTALDASEVTLPGGRHFSDVDVAIASDGKFVAVWENDTHEEGGTDTSGLGVFAQRFNADGTTAGSPIQINSTETNAQERPRVEYDSTDKFTVVWQSYGQEANDGAVIMRTFNGDGTAFSAEAIVNTTTAGEQYLPEIAIDSSDRRIVAWRNKGGGFGSVDFAARVMSADGSALSNEFSRDVSTNFFEGPDVAMAGTQLMLVNPESNGATGVDVRAHLYEIAPPPVAGADTASTPMGKAVTINALANDSNALGGSLTLSIPRSPAHGSATINNGTPADPSDDRIVFTPDSRFIGTESFSYTLTNSVGATATGIVTVTIDGTGNRPPNDIALSSLGVSQSSTAGLNLATISGFDPNNDALTFSLIDNAGGRFAISGNQLVSTSTALNVADISHRITLRATDPSGATYDEDIRVFVIDTPADGLISNSSIDVPLGSQIHGDIDSSNSGRKLTVIGDINGDGYDDIAIGARDADFNSLTDAGKAYVVFGSANGIATPLSVTNLDGTNGFSISGVATNDQLGRGLAGGDVNGDGLADLIVSQPGTTNGAGKVHVIFGKSTAFSATFDITSINGSNGITIQSLPGNSGPLGQDVATGDINADGLQDVVIRSSGDVYVVFGKTSFGSATVSSLNSGADGFRFDNTSVDNLGELADVNGDGYDDLLLGNISSSGEAWVFFGAASFATETPTFSFSTPNTAAGFRMTATGAVRFGTIGSVGDVNGDGFSDIGIGDYDASTDRGRAYILFGTATPAASNIDLSTLNGTTGFSITNTSGSAVALGETIGTAGDFNGDGFEDVMIGGTDTAYAQRVAVVFGGSSFSSSLDLSAINGANGFVIDGGNFYGNFGSSLGAGDINGDGFDDAVIGARTEDGNDLHDAGITYVLHGSDFRGDRVTHLGDASANSITGTSGANAIVAGRANDTVIGSGGADSFRGGQGDDQFEISNLEFQKIVGGSGSDTVRLNNAGGLSLDLSSLKDNRLLGIEQIDLRSGGANTLTLTARDVLNLSDASNTLLVQRGADDTVNQGSGWTQQSNEIIGGLTYNVFTQGNATLKVQDANASAPTVLSILRANASPTAAGSVDFVVTFSESVTGVSAADFVVSASGVTGASVASISGSGTTYTVTVNTGSGGGTLSLDFDADAAGSAIDLDGNPVASDFTTGAAYVVNSTLMTPEDLLIYYGYPSLINSAATLNDAINAYSGYEFVVLGAGLEDPAHPDHANTTAIMTSALTDRTTFFGYVDLGVSTNNYSLSELQTKIAQWRDAGADGIFFDDFGYDFGVSRARQNAAVDYAHSLGLPVVANGFFIDQVFGNAVDATYNPTGAETHLTASDFYLYESYQLSEGAFVSESAWRAKADALADVRSSLPINVLAVTTDNAADVFSQSQFDYGWYSALLDGYRAFGWGQYLFAANDNVVPQRTPPATPHLVGGVSEVMQTDSSYERDLVSGTVIVNSATHTGAITQMLLVTTLTDEDNGSIDPLHGIGVSLREALAFANQNPGSAIIEFAEGLTGTLRLNGTGLTISSDVMLVGPGPDLLTIDGDSDSNDVGNSRLLTIDDLSNGQSATVVISGLTLRHGYGVDANGGAIYNAEDLMLNNVTIKDNLVTGTGQGAGIYNLGHVSIVDSKLLNNASSYGSALYSHGASSTAYVSGTLIDGNSSTDGAAGLFMRGGEMQVVDSIVSNNTAVHGAGVLGMFGADLTIERTRFIDNTAETDGAGLYLYSALGSIRDSVFSSNEASGTGAGVPGGGAIKNDEGSSLIIERSSFNDNSSTVGGAIENDNSTLSIFNSTFFENTATIAGGAIHMVGGTVLSRSNTFTLNTAVTGGAIAQSGTFSAANTIFDDNSATTGPDINGTLTSLGNNLIGDASGLTGTVASDLVGADAKLGTEQLFGNGTSGFLLQSGSAAIDAGNNAAAVDSEGNALATDQRGAGFGRFADGNSDTVTIVDIGAIEVGDGTTNSVEVSVSPSSVVEDGPSNLVFTFTRGAATETLTVAFSVSGTATLTSDYAASGAASFTSTSGTATFADGSKSVTVTINPNTDSNPEFDETVVLTVVSSENYEVGANSKATGTITNDDTPTTVYVDDDWVGLTAGTDPDGAGPIIAIGLDAFVTIQNGINAVAAGGNVLVNVGTYPESVSITKNVSVQGVLGKAVGGETDAVLIDPASGNGITVAAPATSVSLSNLTVTDAVNGISASGAANLTLTNLQLTNQSGLGLVSTSTGDVVLNGGTYDGLSVTNADDVTIGSNGLTATDAISVSAQNALSINGTVDAGSSTVTLAANVDNTGTESFVMSELSSISTTNNSDNAVLITVNSLLGGTGNATLSTIVTGTVGGVVTVNASAGQVVSVSTDPETPLSNNITAYGAVLSGSAGVGTAVQPLLTTIARLEGAGGSGGLFVENSGTASLSIGGLSSLIGLSSTAGEIRVQTESSLTVEENVIASSTGNIQLQTVDTASSDDLNLNAAVTVSSTGGNVVLQSGDSITAFATSVISSGKAVTIGTDVGDSDAAGSTLTLAARVSSVSGTSLTSGNDNDTINISYPSSGTNSGTMTLVDLGGVDAVIINGTSNADSLFLTTAAPTSSTAEQVTRGSATTEAIVIPQTVESLRLNGLDGNDTFNVQPSSLFPITIDGGAPVTGPTVPPGDSLTIDAFGGTATVEAGVIQISGGSPSYQSITSISIESLSVSNTSTQDHQRYDFNSRTVVNGEYVPSATQIGFTSVTQDIVYSAVRGYGWSEVLGAVSGGSNVGPIAALVNDGHLYTTGIAADFPTFKANVTNGLVQATVTFGHPTNSIDGLRIRNGDTGDFLASNLSTSAGQSSHVTVLVNVTDGTLDLRFEDVVGNRMIVISGLDIRPAGQSTLAITNVPNTPLPADGSTTDVFNISGGPSNGLVTVSTSLGTITGTDADAQLAGFQVLTNELGGATISVLRPSVVGSAQVTLSTPTGEGSASVTVTYSTSPSMKFDFNTQSSATQAGYIGIRATDLFTVGTGYGWLSQPRSFSMNPNLGGSFADVWSDGHRNSSAGTFRVNLDNGTYDVHLAMGDTADHAGISVTANGTTLASGISLARQTIFERSFTVTVSNGQLDLTFNPGTNTTLDPSWVVNGIEIRPTTGLTTITPTNIGNVAANGSTITTINAASGLTAGSLVTVSSTLGTITSTDADTTVVGTQVVVGSGGSIAFDLRSPTFAGTPTVEWRALDGVAHQVISNSTFLTFAAGTGAASLRRFDFNRGSSDATMSATAAGFTGVRSNHNTPATDGFGWLTLPSAFNSSSGVTGVTTTALYQDGHRGSTGTSNTFRVQASAATTYDVRVYVGQFGQTLDQVRIVTEGAGTTTAPSTNWDQFTTVTINSATDSNADGFVDITLSDGGGSATGWAIVGLDIASTGNLPSAAGLRAASASDLVAEVVRLQSAAVGSESDHDEQLTAQQLASAIETAKLIVSSEPLNNAQRVALDRVVVSIADLDALGQLGQTSDQAILIDDNGSGLGWSLPSDTLSEDKYDLLSVLLHELGHAIGQEHGDGVMSPILHPGESLIDAAFRESLNELLS